MREYEVTETKGYIVLADSEAEAVDKFWTGRWESESDWDIRVARNEFEEVEA